MDLNMFCELKERLPLGRMGNPALVGIVALIGIVAVVASWHLAAAVSPSEFEVSRASADVAEGESESGASEPGSLFVHVSGAVREPGLCELKEGARVADAVDAAGGFADDAQTESVNLARPVQDGEQIVVSVKGDEKPASPTASDAPATLGGSGAGSGLVNINTATVEELVELPGIGEATAAKIIADRQASGAFKTVDDLKRVSGIGDKKFEALSGLICV